MLPPLAIFGLEGPEIMLVLLLIIVFFGATKIPELARSLGRAKGEFARGSKEGTELAKDEPRPEDVEEQRIRKAAREMGIPVDGRPLADVKADLRAKMG